MAYFKCVYVNTKLINKCKNGLFQEGLVNPKKKWYILSKIVIKIFSLKNKKEILGHIEDCNYSDYM